MITPVMLSVNENIYNGRLKTMKAQTVTDNVVHVSIGAIITGFVYLVGGIDKLFIAFVAFVCLDYITGVAAAFYRNEAHSRVMYWGSARKAFLVVFIIIAHQFDVITGNTSGFMRTAMMMFIIGTEGVSILENAAKLNLPVPAFIMETLVRLRGSRDVSTKIKEDDENEESNG